MKRFIFLLIFILGATYISDAQEMERGYYRKDKKLVAGIVFEKANRIQRAERLIIPQQDRHEATTFYPSDIEGYGFTGESRYISANIILHGNTKRVFLEEIMNLDSVIVYCYPAEKGDLFFLKKGNGLPEPIQNEEDLWNLFRNPSCPEITVFIDSKKKKLNYDTFNRYRKAYADCNTKLFPKFRFGITTEMGLSSRIIGYDTPYDCKGLSLAIGAFAQIPIDEGFSFRPEIIYQIDEHTTIQLPAIFRYNFNYMKGNRIPYIDLGLVADVRTSPEEEIIYDTRYPVGDGKDQQTLANSDTNPFRYGFVLGTGIEFKLKSGHSLYTGIRFRYLQGSFRNEYKDMGKYLTLNIAYGF
ncbi:MAG: PorT family protein [Dysgonamonadaceae bacterium]|jgi:hypothetical protein|nr:PorT family protein [Dysgonamonadaceae bacterium]